MPSGRFVGTSDLQNNSNSLIRDVSASGETCYITENGKAKAVLMDIHRYNAIMDLIEEAESLHRHENHVDHHEHISVRAILNQSTARRQTKRV